MKKLEIKVEIMNGTLELNPPSPTEVYKNTKAAPDKVGAVRWIPPANHDLAIVFYGDGPFDKRVYSSKGSSPMPYIKPEQGSSGNYDYIVVATLADGSTGRSSNPYVLLSFDSIPDSDRITSKPPWAPPKMIIR